MFSGHDCSVNLARMNFDAALLNSYETAKLTKEEENILNDWLKNYT